MHRALILVATAVLGISLAADLWADEAIQTDWSRGGGVSGPVAAWENRFAATAGLSWLSVPGQLTISSSALASPVEHLINSAYSGCIGVGVGDVNGDGDLDVVGTAQTSGMVLLWENGGGDPIAWTEQVIANPPSAAAVDLADLDGDGRLDVVLVLISPRNKIVWRRNMGGDPIVWAAYTIEASWGDAWEIATGDVNGDGRPDVMCTWWPGSQVAWWENMGGDPIVWTNHLVDGALGGAHSVRGADLDGDGDMDLAVAAGVANQILVYWNNGDSPITWTKQVLENDFVGARSVWIDDIDRDGDLDVAGICWTNDLAWWRNDGGNPVVWTRQTISTTVSGGHALCIADVSGDGRPDVLAAANISDKMAWWENGGGDPIVWTEHILNGQYDGSISVRAGDLDGDGDLDPVGVSWGGDQFSWWEATQFDSSGDLTSSVLDTGAGTGMGSIGWTSMEPSGTSLRFQVRSSNDPGDLGAWSDDITSPGNLAAPLDRYVQYKALLETSNPDSAPILGDVTLTPCPAGVETDDLNLPQFRLTAQPNPFNPQVTISFMLKTDETVRLSVLDVRGRLLCELAGGRLPAGTHQFGWDGKDDRGHALASGIYWVCLEGANLRDTRQLVLLR